jgi:hypothetical protein
VATSNVEAAHRFGLREEPPEGHEPRPVPVVFTERVERLRQQAHKT